MNSSHTCGYCRCKERNTFSDSYMVYILYTVYRLYIYNCTTEIFMHSYTTLESTIKGNCSYSTTQVCSVNSYKGLRGIDPGPQAIVLQCPVEVTH